MSRGRHCRFRPHWSVIKMAFLEYYTRLRQFVPQLAPEQCMQYVNEAWRDIREANEEWSFLYAQEFWLAPALISLSGLTVTQWSDQVGLTHAALVLLGGLNHPALTQRQFRAGVTGGPIYSITASDIQQVTDGEIVATSFTLQALSSAPFNPSDVGLLIVVEGAGLAGADLETTIAAYVSPTEVTLTDSASTTVVGATVTWGSSLTLDREYGEDSSTNQGAIVYRIYYSPLTIDFQRLDHLIDPAIGYEFGWVQQSIDVLDRMDPRRSSLQQPYYVFFREFDPDTGLPVYELWPGPTQQRAYPVAYWRLGTEFTNDDDALPPQVPEELLLMRARLLAYEQAMVTDEDARRRQTYMAALNYVRSRYSTEGQPGRPLGLLEKTKRRDKSVYMKQFIRRTRRSGGGWPPIDSGFFQNHGLPALG